MGAGRQRWWRPDVYSRECARWLLLAQPQRYFEAFSSIALAALRWQWADPTLCPEIEVAYLNIALGARPGR